MQWLRNRNVLVVALIVILAVAVGVVGMMARPSRTVTGEPLPDATSSEAPPAGEEALYLLVTVGSITYRPILLDREDVLTLSQGEDTVNTIHVTPESIWMEASTCDNQDCVEQGVVTADNRRSRILGNLIICLPNRVQLELFTAEELQALGILPRASEAPAATDEP